MSDIPPRTGDPIDFSGFRLAGQDPVRGPDFSSIAGLYRVKSEEAGTLGKIGLTAVSALKGFGDALANVAILVAKTGYGVGHAISGEGFSSGWEAAEREMLAETGTTSPGILDLLAPDRAPGQPSVGSEVDDYLNRRLGNYAAIGQTIGTIAAMASNPGAIVAKPALVAAKPFVAVTERLAGKAALASAGAKGVASKDAWQWLASHPEMVRGMSIWGRTAAFAGRHADDVLSVTAANIAQSYAMSKDDERIKALETAAVISPFLVPIARGGQHLSRYLLESKIRPEDAKKLLDAYEAVSSGSATLRHVERTLRSTTGNLYYGFARTVSAPFEGTAILALSPDAWDAFAGMLSGDPEKAGQFWTMYASSVLGVVAAKTASTEQAPMFRALYPRLNRLATYVEAEAASRAAKESKPPENESPKLLGYEGSVEQERALTNSRYEDLRSELFNKYLWAEAPTLAALRGGFTPEMLPEGSVKMTFGRASTVLAREGDTIKVDLDAASLAALRKVGVDLPGDSPTLDRLSLSGTDAQEALDALAQVAVLRRLQHARNQELLGRVQVFDETGPAYEYGVWRDPTTETYYRPDLLGGVEERQGITGDWVPSKEAKRAVAIDTPSIFEHPRINALAEHLVTKQALVPEPLLDSILATTLDLARTSNSLGARMLREYFTNTKEVMDLSKEGYAELVFDLAMLGAESSNPSEILSGARFRSLVKGKPIDVQPKVKDVEDDAIGVIEKIERSAEQQVPTTEILDRVPVRMSAKVAQALETVIAADYEGRSDLHKIATGTKKRIQLHGKSLRDLRGSIDQEKFSALDPKTRAAVQKFLDSAKEMVAARLDPKHKPSMRVSLAPSEARLLIKAMGDSMSLMRPDIERVAAITKDNEPVAIPTDKRSIAELRSLILPKEVEALATADMQSAQHFLKKARMLALRSDEFEVPITDRQARILASFEYGALRQRFLDSEGAIRMTRSELDSLESRVARKGMRSLSRRILERFLAHNERESEAGFLSLPTGEELRGVAEAVSSIATSAKDYFTTPPSEIIARDVPGSPMPQQARAASAEQSKLFGSAARSLDPFMRALRGKEGGQIKREAKHALVKQEQVPGFPGGTVPRAVWLIDKAISPGNRAEKLLQESAQEALLKLWNAAVDVGMLHTSSEPGGPRMVPIGRVDTAVIPREIGRDYLSTLSDPVAREAWHKALIEANPDVGTFEFDSKTKKFVKKPLTVEKLEEEWQEAIRKKYFESPESPAAVEFLRRFPNVAYRWSYGGKVREMFKSDVLEVLNAQLRKQAARVSSVRQWGQEVDQETRAALLESGVAPEVQRNLELGGVRRHIEELSTMTADLPPERRAGVLRAAEHLAARIQGDELVKINEFSRLFGPISSFWSAARTTTAFIRDIPEFFVRLPGMVGVRAAAKAMWAMRPRSIGGMGPEQARKMAEAMGSFDHRIGEWVWNEGRGFWGKASDFVGMPATYVEKLKATAMHLAADEMLALMRAGKAPDAIFDLAEDMLRMTPGQIARLRAGTIPEDLAQQFRREMVEEFTSRVAKSARSQFAANPNIGVWIPFTQWFTRRLESNIRAVGSAIDSIQKNGWASRRTYRAVKRALILVGPGAALSGAIGNALYQVLYGLMSGRPVEDGFQKVWSDFRAGWAHHLFVEGGSSGLLGGPASTTLRAALEPDNPAAWAGLTAVTAAGRAFSKAIPAALRGDVAMVIDMIGAAGFIPFRAQAKALASALYAAAISKDGDYRADSRLVREWMDAAGIKRPTGVRNKPDEFYDAVAEALSTVRAGRSISEAIGALRAALDLAPEESVAAAIEGHQLLRHLSNEQRSQLSEYINNDSRMMRIGQHDAVLKRLAREVRKEEGTHPGQWEAEIDAVVKQAILGITDRWRPLMERALDESSQRAMAGDGLGSQIDDLAEAMASFPEQVADLFDPRTARYMTSGNVDSAVLARRIAAVLRSRARDRVKEMRKESQ